ncbi:MAG: hypothetical protein ACRC3Y_06380 [Romboutsia sp.]|uniref:hypothetical protein n=1 Tax=Romboutsia sp. TaxID=1965302 RepID=UPI003F2EB311
MNDLNIIYTANQNVWEIDLSKILTYTLVIYNLTDETINDLDIEINIPNETEYICNSLKLNGCCYEPYSISKMYISKILPHENIIITLDVKIKDYEYPSSVNSFVNINYLKNQYCKSISYDEGTWDSPRAYVEVNCESPIKSNTKSELLCIPVTFKELYIRHEIDKSVVQVGEILEYKYIIRNNSNLSINEVLLENLSNSQIEFIRDSLYINGINISNNNFRKGIYIGFIEAKKTVLVTFKAVVRKIKSLNAVSTKGVLSFFYQGEYTYGRLPNKMESNEVVLDLCPNISKSLNVFKVIEKVPSIRKIDQIIDVFNYDINITSTKMLSQSYSSGKTLLLSGCINGRVTYNSEININDYHEDKMYVIEYNIPFKIDILVPEDFNEEVQILPSVQFIDASVIDDEKIYLNSIVNIDLIKN